MKIIRRYYNLFILFLNKKENNDNSPSNFNIYAYNGQCKIIINLKRGIAMKKAKKSSDNRKCTLKVISDNSCKLYNKM